MIKIFGTSRPLSKSTIGLALIVLAVTRSGINAFGALDSHVASVATFPQVEGYFRSSWMHFAVWHILGFTASWQAVVYGAIVTAAIFILAWRYVGSSRGADDQLLAFGLVALSSISTILFQHLGIYDALLILGAIILAGSTSLIGMVFGATLLLGANFELGLAALLSLAALSFSEEIELDRRKLMLASASAVLTSLVALVGWFGNFLGGDSRTSWLQQHLRGSIVNFAISLPFLLLSFFGVAWLVVIGFLQKSTSKRDLISKLVALVLLPGLATALTLDGTRVFVCASAPAFLALIIRGKRPLSELLPWRMDLRSFVAISILVPAVMVHFGSIKMPYEILYGRL